MMQRYQISFGRLPEEKRITVAKLPALIRDLRRSIEQLQSWGVRVPVLSRIRGAEKALMRVAETASYGTSPSELRSAAQALVIARDFAQIVDSLGPTAASDLTHQLTAAMKGTLTAHERARAPYQFQTQFLVGAVLMQGNLYPRVPPANGQAPDYVVRPGTVQYGVEVKRPEGRRGSFESLSRARDQLQASGLHGVVVLDLTDCLDELGLRRIDTRSEEFPSADLKQPYKELVEQLSDVVWDWNRRAYRPGFERVMGIWFITRGWRWIAEDLSAPHLFEFQGFYRFASSTGNIWYHRGDEFHSLTLNGMRKNGLFINQAEHESPQDIRRPFWDRSS